MSNLSRRGGRGRGCGVGKVKVKAGVRRDGRDRFAAGRAGLGEKTIWTTPGVNDKWEVEQLAQKRNTLHGTCCTTLVAHHFHCHPILGPMSPSPQRVALFQRSSFPASSLTCTCRIELLACGAKPLVSCPSRLHENIPREDDHVARHKREHEIDSGTVEWSAQGMPGTMEVPKWASENRRMSSLRGIGTSQSTNPVKMDRLDRAIHAGPPSVRPYQHRPGRTYLDQGGHGGAPSSGRITVTLPFSTPATEGCVRKKVQAFD